MTAARADIGFCQDPDADRLAVIDAAGRYIGEEYTVALCVEQVLRHAQGPIVTNCSSSRMAQDLAERAGVPSSARPWARPTWSIACWPTARSLAARATATRSIRGWAWSATVSSAWRCFLDAMAERELPIGAMADALPRYEIVKTKIALAKEKIPAALTRWNRISRRGRRPHGRAAIGLARPLALGPRQQHRADRPRDRRGPRRRRPGGSAKRRRGCETESQKEKRGHYFRFRLER